MPQKKTYNVCKRLDKRAGCREEYTVLLNNKPLRGKVVRSHSKGKETWETIIFIKGKRKVLDTYDPMWLAHKNGRRVDLKNHPAMATALEYYAANPARSPWPWKPSKKTTLPELKQLCKDEGLEGYSTMRRDEIVGLLQSHYLKRI